jgi:lipoprotein-anchoring transpeptidase ErfK/SrfK
MTKIIITLIIILFIYAGMNIYMFSPLFAIEPTNQEKTLLMPDQSFEINFSQPIQKDYYKKHITLEPRTPMQAVVNKEHNKITLIPATAWETDTIYTVSLPSGRAKNLMPIKTSTFKFKIIDHPQVTSITPTDGTKDILIDMEEPITVNFDKSTEGFFIDFQFEPSLEVVYQNNEDKTSFQILPKEKLAEDTNYTLTIKSKPVTATDNKYKKLTTSSFATLPPKPKTWSEKLDDRLIEAKKYTNAKVKSGKYIDINLATQIMTIFENGKNIGTYLISSGKRGMETPVGNHQIYNKAARPWSNKYKLYMPYWMAITPDGKYGIHELPEWPSGYKEGANHLGIPVSHGCVRLGVSNASNVYNWAEIGTPINVHY